MYAYDSARKTGRDPKVLAVDVQLRKTADLDDTEIQTRISVSLGIPFPKSLQAGSPQTRPRAEAVAITEFLQNDGYDSAIGRGGNELVVYDPRNSESSESTLRMKRVAFSPIKHYKLNRSLVNKLLRNLNDADAREESKRTNGGYSEHSLEVVPIRDVNVPPVWHPGREKAIQEAIVSGKKLPPVRLSREGTKWEISDGIHRTNVSKQMGFTHIPAIVSEWVETPDELVPEEPEKQQLEVGDWVKLRKPEKGLDYGYVDEKLGPRRYRGVKRYWYSVTLVNPRTKEEDWLDMSDTEFDSTSRPRWAT